MKKTSIFITLLIIIGLFVGGWYGKQHFDNYNNLKNRINNLNKQNRQNTKALTDSVNKYKNEAGEYLIENTSLALTIDNLKLQNKELYNEYKGVKGQVDYLTRINLRISERNKILNKRIKRVSDSLVNIKWATMFGSVDSNFALDIIGDFNFKSDTLLKEFDLLMNESNIGYDLYLKLITGIEYDKSEDLYKLFVKNKYKNIKIDLIGNINPDLLYVNKTTNTGENLKDEIKNRYGLGIFTGPGFSFDMGNKVFVQNFTWNVGVGLYFSIYKF